MTQRKKNSPRPWLSTLAVLLVWAPMAFGQAASPEVAPLRPQWEPGQSARYEFWNRFEQTVEARVGERSQSQSLGQEVTGEITWTVDRVKPEGGASCTMTLDWMAVEATGPAGTIKADSRKGATAENKTMHQLLSAMAKAPVKVEVAADGHVVSVSGIEAMRSKTPEPDNVPSELDFEESASDLASIAFAPGPVAGAAGVPVGHTWSADFRWDHDLGKMNQAWEYELERIEQIAGLPVAVIEGTARLTLDPELPADRPADAPPLTIKLDQGSAKAQILFDPLRREAIARHTSSDEKITVSMPFPNGQKFVRTVHETTTGQLLRISEE